MFLAGLTRHLKPHRWPGGESCPLGEAAALAQAQACAEHLPVATTLPHDAARWHAESILRTVPVYGVRGGQAGQVEPSAGLVLDAGARTLGAPSGEPVWRELSVKREDFKRYIAWLRSIW